jgi:hypothetical protein
VPFHESFAGLENAETLILVHGSRLDQRLLANDAVAFDLGILTDRIVNQPPSGRQSRRVKPDVLDADEVREDVMSRSRLTLVAKILGPDSDSNSGSFSIEKRRRHEMTGTSQNQLQRGTRYEYDQVKRGSRYEYDQIKRGSGYEYDQMKRGSRCEYDQMKRGTRCELKP